MSEYLSIMMKFASARHNPFFHLFPPLWHVSSAETSNPTSLINYANLIHASFATSSPSPFSTLFLLSLSQFSRLVIWIFITPWTTACQASLSLTISWILLNSCPLSWWCHPIISSSVVPFSSCLQSFPESESFPMSWLFTSGGQSSGASASVLEVVKFLTWQLRAPQKHR